LQIRFFETTLFGFAEQSGRAVSQHDSCPTYPPLQAAFKAQRMRSLLFSLLLFCMPATALAGGVGAGGVHATASLLGAPQALLFENMGPVHADKLSGWIPKDSTPRAPDRFDEMLALPQVKAALATIRFAEGADYNRLFGYFTDKNRVFDHLQQVGHPRLPFRTPGGYVSSAAGAYQALPDTWDEEVRKGSMEDRFNPYNQDRFALARLEFRGLLDDVVAGRLWWIRSRAMGHEWASFPASPYNQPRKSGSTLERFYRKQLQNYTRQASTSP
jgi:muramidase (phage lysozyme)